MIKISRLATIVGLFISGVYCLTAFQYPAPDTLQQVDIEKAFSQLASSSIGEKLAASEFLVKLTPEEIGPIVLSKVQELFLAEGRSVRRFNALLGPRASTLDAVPEELRYINQIDWKMYFMNLRDIAAKSKDIRILPDLIEFRVSPDAILNYGEAGVEPTLHLLSLSDLENVDVAHDRRTYAVRVLVEFIRQKDKGYVAIGLAREKIVKSLTDHANKDKDVVLRALVIKSFGDLGDEEFLPTLELLASSDDYSKEVPANPKVDRGKEPGQKIIRFPIRMAAQEAAEKIKQKRMRQPHAGELFSSSRIHPYPARQGRGA